MTLFYLIFSYFFSFFCFYWTISCYMHYWTRITNTGSQRTLFINTLKRLSFIYLSDSNKEGKRRNVLKHLYRSLNCMCAESVGSQQFPKISWNNTTSSFGQIVVHEYVQSWAVRLFPIFSLQFGMYLMKELIIWEFFRNKFCIV